MYAEPSPHVNSFSRGDGIPPHSIEAEQALLGRLLFRNEELDNVSSLIEAAHFFDPVHQQIYETLSRLIGGGRSATPVTLAPFFQHAPPITDGLTVPDYVGRLVRAAPPVAARAYAQTVRDLAVRRSLIAIAEDVIARAWDSPDELSPEAQIEAAEGQLYALVERRQTDHETTIGVAMTAVIERMNEAYRTPGQLRGLSTGLSDLDHKMGGLEPSDLIVLAGRPSMGKSALAVNIAFHVARNGTPDANGEVKPGFVDFYSLEMSAEQLAARILAEQSEIPSTDMRRGQFSEAQFRVAMHKATLLRDLPFRVDSTGGLSIAQLSARARRNKRKHNTALIVVDYLQLMRSANSRGNAVEDITEITTGLKALAKDLNVPVIALSQLSREVEKRGDKRPQLSDLRGSGSIEQDADIVMFVYRDDYYLERSPPDEDDMAATAEWRQKMASASGKAEVIIAKHRHAGTGVVHLAFDGKSTRFSNIARDGYGRAA